MSARRGFTILEALVALAIVGLAGVAAMEALGGELRTADRARQVYRATALAEDRMAAVQLLSATELATLPDSIAKGAFRAPFETYRWTATALAVPDERDLYDVVVRVEGDAVPFELRTRLYRPRPVAMVR